ncbi:TlpA family protein disulfide reductase [Flavobacterium zepuense]|uniref:TlpA family protein disulfide reductase n=1 Tax=Flavobacterium zepuense TaxID=2593302 RepID=A0A552V1K0_9FLAO|nr:TlpA disulfide reductase family protein [Flavobacterium zepuense]TRW24322.1 TlpA family protein disulfide reductase [Flavobacterium zepuense]
MISKLHLGLIVAFFTCTLHAQKADRAFVKNVVNNYNKATSISYDVHYKIKYFDSEDTDTTTVNGHCKLIRDAKDTIFGGGRIWMDFDADTEISSHSLYYDLEYLYVIEPNKKELTKFEPLKDETGPITAATQGVLKNTFFLKPERLLEYLDDNNNRYTIEEVKTGAKKMVRVTVNFPDEDDMSNKNIAVYINHKTSTIEKITFFCQLLDQHQYNEWNLSNIKFNTVNQNTLNSNLKDYASKYSIKDFEFPKEELTGLIQGTPAPQFTAQLYSTGLQTQLSDYKGKIVLLDFWYAAFAPCASASPYLTALQQKYKDAVVVIGINPFETHTEDLKKVTGFSNRYKVGYTLAAIEESVADAYKVGGFPTLYLIDREGVV